MAKKKNSTARKSISDATGIKSEGFDGKSDAGEFKKERAGPKRPGGTRVKGSAVFITDGNDHQQVVAPGYEMCYIWMIRHLPDDPWYKTTRFVSDEHQWLTK